MDIPFFKGISKEMFAEFAHNVEMQEMNKDEIVFRGGDKGDKFFLIIHGEVRIEMDKVMNTAEIQSSPAGQKKNLRRSMSMDIGHLGPGKYFGEMALVDKEHTERSATAICNKHSILLSVSGEVFHKIFDENPQALVEFRLRVQQDKAELKHILEHQTGMVMFETFLKKELADENINFYKAVQAYKKGAHDHEKVAVSAGKRITKMFINTASETQVNIPGKMRKELEERVTREFGAGSPVPDGIEADEHLFDKAEAEIYKLMVRDNYARFKKTAEFREFFEGLGIFLDHHDD